jgi:hypothetical protein
MFPFMFQNLQSSAIKKYLFEMLQERYAKNEKFIDRLASTVTTKEDYEALGGLMVDIFECGFMKALNEYKEQVAKMGLKVSVVPDKRGKTQEGRIFGQSEKSG